MFKTGPPDSPDQYKLSKDDSKKISDWFNEKAKDGIECNVCASGRWFNHSIIYTPIYFNLKKNRHIQSRLLPTAIIECQDCGNQLYFSAQKIGIDFRKYADKRDGD